MSRNNQGKHWVEDVNNCHHDPIGLEKTWKTKWCPNCQFTLLLSIDKVNSIQAQAQARASSEKARWPWIKRYVSINYQFGGTEYPNCFKNRNYLFHLVCKTKPDLVNLIVFKQYSIVSKTKIDVLQGVMLWFILLPTYVDSNYDIDSKLCIILKSFGLDFGWVQSKLFLTFSCEKQYSVHPPSFCRWCNYEYCIIF